MNEQPILTTPEEEKHVEIGIYQENDQILEKPDTENERLIRRSLEKLDAEVEEELKEIKEWKKEMYKDFENPTCPTVKELLGKCIQTLGDISKLKMKIVGFYREEKMRGLLSELFTIIENLTKQSEMLSDILGSKGDPEEIEVIHRKYDHLGEFTMNIRSRAQICWKTLRSCLDYLLKNLLLDLHKTVQHLSDKVGVYSEDTKATEIQIMAGKMKVVSEYLPLAAIFNPSDIFALEENDPYLVDLKKHVQIKELGPTEAMKKSFQKFIKGVHVGVSMMSKGAEQENILARKLTVSFGAVYYYICSNEAQKQTNLFYSRPTEKTAFQTWNMLEDEFLANMMKITLPSIKYAKKTYINRMYKPLTLRTLKDAMNSNILNSLSPLTTRMGSRHQLDEVTTLATKDSSLSQVKLTNKDKIPILVLSNKNLCLQRFTELEISQKQTSTGTGIVDVVAEKHVENPKPLEIKPNNKEEESLGDKFMAGLMDICRGFGCLSSELENPVLDPYFDGLIIHIHGGGFVSMSASSHQNYTRQWAKLVKKPVLSIDYRLAPEHQYPNALDDCWQAYSWIVQYAEEVLGIRPSKIILAGDSAGANLSLGVTALALKHGIKPPDGLFLAYPALRLENKSYSPSLMLALEDQVVPYSLLKLCIQSYVPSDADPSQDPFLSPIHMSEELLKKLPPIRMVVGGCDPLHDDCWRFTDKLRKLGNDVFLTVYKDMCHGFLGYDMPMGMPEARICVQDSAEMISELFNIKKKSQAERKL